MIKRSIVTVLSLVVILWLAGASAWAQGRSGSHPGGTGGTGTPRGSSGNSATNNSSTHGSNSSSNSLPGEVLSRNSSLSGALTNALSKSGISLPSGMTLAQTCASAPFKTLGRCIAALHINHKFPACSLMALSSSNLGQAIKVCNPNVPAKAEARTATKQANADIRDSESESGSSGKS
ncbi:MAG TPA: hypothetical protein VF860_03265 [Candidatus Acidoferrales bacterium]